MQPPPNWVRWDQSDTPTRVSLVTHPPRTPPNGAPCRCRTPTARHPGATQRPPKPPGSPRTGHPGAGPGSPPNRRGHPELHWGLSKAHRSPGGTHHAGGWIRGAGGHLGDTLGDTRGHSPPHGDRLRGRAAAPETGRNVGIWAFCGRAPCPPCRAPTHPPPLPPLRAPTAQPGGGGAAGRGGARCPGGGAERDGAVWGPLGCSAPGGPQSQPLPPPRCGQPGASGDPQPGTAGRPPSPVRPTPAPLGHPEPGTRRQPRTGANRGRGAGRRRRRPAAAVGARQGAP